MNKYCIGLTILTGVASAVAPAAEPAFRYRREVLLPQLAQEELVAITLDAEVYAATRDDLADVRLSGADGQIDAFVQRKAQTIRTRTERRTWRVNQQAARPLDTGPDTVGLEIVVELDEDDPQPNGLSLITRLANFEQRVRVESSADGQSWQPAGEETVIFDYSRYIDARNVDIPLPATDHRHFRIVIDDVTAEQELDLQQLTRRVRNGEEEYRDERTRVNRRPFRVDRIEFWQEVEIPRSRVDTVVDYPVIGFDVEQDADAQQTLVTIDTDREPLTEFRLVTPSRNFSRTVRVQVERQQGVRTSWREIARGTLSRIDFKSLQRENLSIDIPETRGSHFRMVIENRDSPPPEVAGIEATGSAYQLVFLANPESEYTLAYGNSEAEPARFDTATIRQLLRGGFEPTAVQLGEPTESTARGSPLRWSKLLGNRLLLVTVITVLVIVLGWGLYQASQRVDRLPE